MDEFEELSRRLTKLGYWPTCSLTREGWHCNLANSALYRPARGSGETALEALIAADADRQELIARKAG